MGIVRSTSLRIVVVLPASHSASIRGGTGVVVSKRSDGKEVSAKAHSQDMAVSLGGGERSVECLRPLPRFPQWQRKGEEAKRDEGNGGGE
jgi:hypothetical protein